MKTYNITCPICGTVNHNLLLDETDGWMECEKCQSQTMQMSFPLNNLITIPLFTSEQLARLVKARRKLTV